RTLRGVPVACVVSGGSVQLRTLRRDRSYRFLLGRTEGVANNKRGIVFAKERHMAVGMAGRVNPSPTGKAGQRPVFGQSDGTAAQVNRPARVERRQYRHQPAS